jgi:hypothetical protein
MKPKSKQTDPPVSDLDALVPPWQRPPGSVTTTPRKRKPKPPSLRERALTALPYVLAPEGKPLH